MAISLPPKGNDAKKLGSNFAPLQVEAQATPNMTVKVAEGAFWTANNEFMEYIGGTSPIISAPTSDAKWVLVTITSTGMLNIVNGVASGTPNLPQSSQYKDELPLAAIFVGDTTTGITNDMVYDLRPLWAIPPDSVSQSQLSDFATITYVDNGLNTKAESNGTSSFNFTLNVGGQSINESGIYVDRFSGPDVGIRFNETAIVGSPPVSTPSWEFTNDGTTWNPIGVSAGSYYTKADLDAGGLDFLYYTQNDINPLLPTVGVLDSRFYTMGLADSTFATITHQHVPSDIIGFVDPVNTINGVAPTLGNISLGLDELNGVVISGPTTGAVIRYDGTDYRNTVLLMDDLGDVVLTVPQVNDALLWNGSVFLNRPLLKSDISDFTGTEFLLTTNLAGDLPAGDGPPDSNGTPQDVYGVKTFKDGLEVESYLKVSGANTSIETTDLKVTDPYIDLNWGEVGPGVSVGTAGIRIDRGTPTGSPVSNPPAIMQWDETAKQWEFGVEGNASPVLTGAHTHIAAQISDFNLAVEADLLSHNINIMNDVSYATVPLTGEYLRYGVNSWENKVFATDVVAELNVNNLDQLQDVAYLGSPLVASGEVLQWNGALWVNHTLIKSDVSDFVETDYIHTNSAPEIKAGDLTINGNFTVGSGTTTTINSDTLNIFDPVLTVNYGETGSGVDGGTGTAGIEVDRGISQNAMLYWSEPGKTWLAHHTIAFGSPPSPTLTISPLSFDGHQHVVSDIVDLAVSATQINTLTGINTGFTVQQQLDDKISRQGDAMDNTANLMFAVGGEVLGLPAIPSTTAATSKEYVDTEVARKIDRTGDAMDANANLSFSGTGEVLGLPAIPSATAATSKEYVDAHIADLTAHMTTDQNVFLDGLLLTGSPAITATDVNQLTGISGNVQTLLDTKTDKLTPAIDQNLAALDIATGNIVDSGVVVNDAGVSVNDIWTANQIDTVKADKIIPSLISNLASLDATGNLLDSGLILNDAGVLVSEIWSANQIDTVKMDKQSTAVVGNFGEFDAAGNLVDNGNNPATFAPIVHTHVVADITDFATGVTTELNNNSISEMSDFTSNAPAVNDFLRWTGTIWDNIPPTSITTFVKATGNVNETVDGNKTFSGITNFQNNIAITGTVGITGSTTISGNLTVQGDQITIGEEIVTANRIIVNSGSTDPLTAHGGGIVLERDSTGSPPSFNEAVLLWDETVGQRWKAGLYDSVVGASSIENIALENITPAQPLYELVVGTGTAIYNLGFGVSAPAAGKTGVQVFVNGIKQIEGAAKAYTVDYTNIAQMVITFNVGSEPAVSADVEFYGFGFIG